MAWQALLSCSFYLFYAGQIIRADHYSEVRLLSARHYADTHNVQQDLPEIEKHTAGRLLFSWDLPQESPKDHLKTNQSKIGKDDQNTETAKKPRNKVWWPWKNYEEWLASRTSQDRHRNDRTLLQISPGTKYDTPRDASKIGHKLKRNRKHKKRKYKNKNKNNKSAIVLKNKLLTVEHISGLKNEPLKISVKNIKNSKLINQNNESNITKEMSNEILNKSSHIETRSLQNMNKMSLESKEVGVQLPTFRNDKNINKDINDINHSFFKHTWKPPVLLMAIKNYTEGDINECVISNGGCEGLCINLPGSYRCHCPSGFRLDSSGRKCLDVNECVARNGHGECQGGCINTWGSYHCTCDAIAGTMLAADGKTCQDIDECNNSSCSHSCVNTIGSAFCLCPDGYMLGPDLKNCQDIDE